MKSGDRLARTKPAVPPVVFVYLGVIVITWAVNSPLMKLALSQVPSLARISHRVW